MWEYLEENRKMLMEEARRTERHSRDVNKILWWNQRFRDKSEMVEKDYFWFT